MKDGHPDTMVVLAAIVGVAVCCTLAFELVFRLCDRCVARRRNRRGARLRTRLAVNSAVRRM